MMKNKGAGWILTILSAVLAAASLVMYLVNCRTDYFATFGISPSVAGCLAAGILVQVLALVLCLRGGNRGSHRVQKGCGGRNSVWISSYAEKMPVACFLDLFPVASSAVLMAAAVCFIGSRINEFAFILTFQKNDDTLADMRSGVIGIALCLLALIVSWIAAFFDITKDAELTKEE